MILCIQYNPLIFLFSSLCELGTCDSLWEAQVYQGREMDKFAVWEVGWNFTN